MLTDNSNYMSSSPPLSVIEDTCDRKEGEDEKRESSSFGGSKGRSPSPLRRSASTITDAPLCASPELFTPTLIDTVLVQIGRPDHEGWVRKRGGHFSTWKTRYLVLKGPHLYWLKSDSPVVCVTWLGGVAFHRV